MCVRVCVDLSQNLLVRAVPSSVLRVREGWQVGAPAGVEAALNRSETGTRKNVWTGQVQTVDVRVLQPIRGAHSATAPALSAENQSVTIKIRPYGFTGNRTTCGHSHGSVCRPSAGPSCDRSARTD